MFSKLQERFGTAGLVVAIMALVIALAGTAIAAQKALNGKQKKEVQKIAKKYAGKPGKDGAQGPAGPAGPQGAPGGAGSQGKQGATGPTGLDGADGADGATGPTGDPWTAGGTLPEGETETGAWSFGKVTVSEFTDLNLTVSFPIPLSSPLPEGNAHLINAAGEELVLDLTPGEEGVKEVPPTQCLGTVESPTANPGHFCMYAARLDGSFETLSSNEIFSPSSLAEFFSEVGGSTGTTGARVRIAFSSGTAKGWGTWAVTAPEL